MVIIILELWCDRSRGGHVIILKFEGDNPHVRYIKVMGTQVYLEITVTRFMQPMSILTLPRTKVGSGIEPIQTYLHFITPTSCCGEATRTPWPLPHGMLNSERIPQTFFVACRIALSAS